MVETIITVTHPGGLHLRAAARFVQIATQFGGDVWIKNLSHPDAENIDAKSLFGIMQSGIAQGHRLWLGAEGPDAAAALDALEALIERNFEES